MRASSLEAWAHIRAKLPAKRREALELLLQFPGKTARQLQVLAGGCGIKSWEYLDRRWSELEEHGLVVSDARDRRAVRWWPLAEAPPDLKPRRKKVPRKQLEKVFSLASSLVGEDAGVASLRDLRDAVREAQQ